MKLGNKFHDSFQQKNLSSTRSRKTLKQAKLSRLLIYSKIELNFKTSFTIFFNWKLLVCLVTFVSSEMEFPSGLLFYSCHNLKFMGISRLTKYKIYKYIIKIMWEAMQK